jgi:hypothetical protein
MKRLILPLILSLGLAACAHVAIDPNATPAQVAAAKAQAAQANFDSACKWASGAVDTAGPLVPLLAPKLGNDGTLAVQSFIAAVKTTCASPLDITNADAITQRIYDDAGQVIALVIKAQQT